MTLTNKYLDGFHTWWTAQGHPSRSADGYRSGIRRVNDEFFVPAVKKNMFDVLDDAISSGSAVDWLTALIGSINARIGQTDDVTARKRLQDNRSQLKRFIDYVAELQDSVAASEADDDAAAPELLPDGKQYYDRDMLVRNFALRIKTQDRMSDGKNVFFPIRIVGRLFTAADRDKQQLFHDAGLLAANGKPIEFRRWFKDWVRNIVENVIFHTPKGDYRLAQIDGLLIDSKRMKAWVRVNGKDIVLLSESPEGMREMKISSLRNIHLDHAERMEDLLIRLEPVLMTMRQLTDDIKAAVKDRKVTVNGVVIQLDKYRPRTLTVLSNWYCDNVDWNRIAPLLPLLFTELNYIAAATRLVAMSDADNLRKH
ncbi:MAG: hypothetical protein K2N28_07005 [Muribaculaceae bacterium]|nr:hypothetical protein [Muribaculaceae bacterium]